MILAGKGIVGKLAGKPRASGDDPAAEILRACEEE